MERRRLGGTGPEVSALCLGTMTFGGQTAPAEAFAQLDRAVAAGIDFLDTAEMYPTNPVRAETVGRTEAILGAWLAARGGRGRLVIATKVTGAGNPHVRGGAAVDARTIEAAVEGSLRRLGTDAIDLYQLHWPNRGSYHFRKLWAYDPSGQDRAATLAHMAEALAAMDRLVRAGKVRHFGLSNETAWGMAQWLRLAEAGAGPRPLTIQNEYSLLCRTHDADLAELGVNEGVTLLAFSPLAAGLLTGKYQGDATPPGSRRAATPDLGGRVTARVWPAVEAYLRIAAEHGLHPVAMAVAFVLSRPFPAIPIVGATTAAQLEAVLPAAGLRLAPEVLRAIAAAHRAHPLPF